VVVTPTALYVRELVGARRVAIFDHDAIRKARCPCRRVSVEEMEALGNGTLLYSVETYLDRPTSSDIPKPLPASEPLAANEPVSFDDTEVIRDVARRRRDEGSGQHHPSQGHGARRHESSAAHGLWGYA